ncbi:MAG TPA: hypothetical protein VMQ76_05545 [Terracidiphilus sp.]|jgi:hypothetical protein|nr:hypothetical protein [Terracidiphilus sp.]
MARYFQSPVVGRPLMVGGQPFVFEPCEPMGGSWLGVLALDEPSASVLGAVAAGGTPTVWEITEAQYDKAKKKTQTEANVSRGFPRRLPSPPPSPADAVAAGEATNSQSGGEPGVRDQPSVTLQYTDQQPPIEPLLQDAGERRRNRAA